MKKLLFILLTAICFIGCKSFDYSIEGSLGNKALNGTKIYLRERIDREWKTLDSTVIENGTFAFKGVAEKAKIAFLSYEYPAENRVRQALVLEAGVIKISIDAAGVIIVKGTLQNDLLQSYMDEKLIYFKKS